MPSQWSEKRHSSEALNREYFSALVTIRGEDALIYNTPQGWVWLHLPKTKPTLLKSFHCVEHLNKCFFRGALKEIVLHLTQQTWDWKDCTVEFLDNFDPEIGESYLKWIKWQIRYKNMIDSGLGFTENEAHHIASNFYGHLSLSENQLAYAKHLWQV